MGPAASGASGALTLPLSGKHASSVPARASPGSRLSLHLGCLASPPTRWLFRAAADRVAA